MVQLSFFQLRVTYVKLKNIKLHLKLLTGKLKKNSLYFILYTILYRNINRKALKRLLFFRLCELLTTHHDFKPMDLYPCGLKSGIIFSLEPGWACIRVGLYSSFYGNLRTPK